jgi:two-component system, OmpR family, sensor histidine kinase VicK
MTQFASILCCRFLYTCLGEALSTPLGILSEAEEKTIVLRGEERTTNALLEFAANTKTRMDVCADRLAPSVSVGVPELKKGMIDMVTRGVKYRYITEITKDNLLYCKELAQYVELRHLEGLRGNFAVNESEYLATAVVEEEAKPVPEIIYSAVRSVVEQHQYLFLALWDKAVPAEHRIREIEQGIEPQRITVIYDAEQALELYQSLIMSAEKEIKVVFPTTNALIRQDKAGILFLLQEAAKKCQVKVLVPNDELIHNFIRNDIGISTRFIEQEERGKATILIVDNKVSLMMELKDDNKKTFHEAIGLSTYSNSKAGVLSYVSMFESLWKQTQLYEELKSNEKMQKEFINIAAHELRTPTQAILGYAELIQGQDTTKVNKDEAFSKIVKNAERLQRLTEDVLDVTRIESQTLKLDKRKFNLSNIAASVLDDYRNRIQNGENVKLVLLNADKPAFVVADKGRISQVLSNLVGNALKFTKSGTVSVSIEISNNDGKKEFIVSVKDTGTGIDSDIMPRLFTKFVSKSETGTGLGLFISKSIVEAHGGRIWAENNPDGKGATFRFSLPEG